jgi:hypothetical protein
MLPMLSLTQRHIGGTDVLVVTRVGTVIKADSAHTQRFPYKGTVAERCSIPTVRWGMAMNNATFPYRYIVVDPSPSRFGSPQPSPSTRSTPDRSASHSLLLLSPKPRLRGLAGPGGCCGPRCSVLQYVAWLWSAESGPQPCSGLLMTPAAAGWCKA